MSRNATQCTSPRPSERNVLRGSTSNDEKNVTRTTRRSTFSIKSSFSEKSSLSLPRSAGCRDAQPSSTPSLLIFSAQNRCHSPAIAIVPGCRSFLSCGAAKLYSHNPSPPFIRITHPWTFSNPHLLTPSPALHRTVLPLYSV
jgi:hypothetical protein